jgi:hypothetical protein
MRRLVAAWGALMCLSGPPPRAAAQPPAGAKPLGELTTTLGVLILEGAEEGDSFPPNCGKPSPMCSPAKPGYKVLVVWLKPKTEVKDLMTALMGVKGVFVQSADGKKTDKFAAGMVAGRHFVGFTPPVSAKGHSLHWGDNPPVSLGK